ncbi:MAG: hypothetical protein Q4C58_04785 [Eubacteriales bacterium]|nr:hypothetical protein [Eubacteriales bacterium]
MKHFWRNIDSTVKEMWLGIGIWGVACELVMVWFVRDKAGCSLGILVGCLLAAAGVWHMWKVLDTALDLGDGAQKYLTVRSWIRYGVFVAVFGVLMITGWANPLTAFLGLMGMKAAAYLQPAVHKFIEKRR